VRDEFIAKYLAERKRTARTISGQDASTKSIRSPRLIEVAPELMAELPRLLRQQGESALADQVADLALVYRCRCGDSATDSAATIDPPWPAAIRRLAIR
jgi:hypothetical protein